LVRQIDNPSIIVIQSLIKEVGENLPWRGGFSPIWWWNFAHWRILASERHLHEFFQETFADTKNQVVTSKVQVDVIIDKASHWAILEKVVHKTK
jgi:hypothetical protein